MTEPRSNDERPESGDSAQTLRNRLAALDGLHADGHLTDEEHRVARQMAISGPVGPTAPVVPTGKGGELPPQASSPSDGQEREGRHPLLLPVVAGVLIAAVIALIAVLVFAIGANSTSQPSAASAPSKADRVRVVKTLNALYVGSSSGRCFGPRSGASFTINGDKIYSDFLNCGDDDPSTASGTYEFKDLPDGTIKTFKATLAIDEGSYSAQHNSTAHFLVTYGDKTICEATITWGNPYRCNRPSLNIPTSSGTLVIEQDVTPSSNSVTSGLWVGLVGGRIGISVKR